MQRLPLYAFLALLALGACDGYTGDDSSSLTGSTPPFQSDLTTDDPGVYHPIVLSGQGGFDLQPLIGLRITDLVAFAYDASTSTFAQIPLQVDERYVYDPARVYAGVTNCNAGWCDNVTNQAVTLGYADPDGFAGADPNTKFDADDEIALLLADFGNLAPRNRNPNGVDRRKAVEVRVTSGGEERYAYVYKRRDQALDPAAGQDYVAYHFETVASGYNIAGVGPRDFTGYLTPNDHGVSNPERSWVEADGYRMQFADRWIMDYLAVGPAAERSPDLLTLDLFRGTDNPTTSGFSGCVRWPFTGSASEGGLLVNRDGPIRAIRRMIGFNSGPLTEMTWTFYPYSAELDATPRVHRLGHGLAIFLHLSDAANGYTYGYGAGGGGPLGTDLVNGADPAFSPLTLPGWQTLTDPAGGYGWAAVYAVDTSIPFYQSDEQPRLFYNDDGALLQNCNIDDVTGSTYNTALTTYRGSHGIEIPFQSSWGAGTHLEDGGLPNTDPRNADANTPVYDLRIARRLAFGPDPAAALAAIQETPAIAVQQR